MNNLNSKRKDKDTNTTNNIVFTGIFTAIIIILSQIAIPTSPVPFTLSLLAIFLTGILLPPRQAFLAVLVYILLGAFGLPVFAGMKGGVSALFGPTGGYILAYPLMALIISLSRKYARKYKTLVLILGMLVSLFICYLLGTLWFSYITGTSFAASLALCVYPYIIFDLLKIGLAIFFSSILGKTCPYVFRSFD